MRCRFCGIGAYQKLTNFQATGDSMHGQNNSFFACDNCGHLVEFYGTENRKLPGWEE